MTKDGRAYIPASNASNWETPGWLFSKLNAVYGFTHDAAADESNHKCERYWSGEPSDTPIGWNSKDMYWCNPPYGRSIGDWLKSAHISKAKVIWLLPARVDTRWFHSMAEKHQMILLKGRLKFELKGQQVATAPFPSMLLFMNLPIVGSLSGMGVTIKPT